MSALFHKPIIYQLFYMFFENQRIGTNILFHKPMMYNPFMISFLKTGELEWTYPSNNQWCTIPLIIIIILFNMKHLYSALRWTERFTWDYDNKRKTNKLGWVGKKKCLEEAFMLSFLKARWLEWMFSSKPQWCIIPWWHVLCKLYDWNECTLPKTNNIHVPPLYDIIFIIWRIEINILF